MVNANSPCHPLAFDKRMVRRMALLIRAGTNFISWTYFSQKTGGNCGKFHASKGSWESQGLNPLHQVDVPEIFLRNKESWGMWIFLRQIQVDFSKARGILWSPCWDDYAMAMRKSLQSEAEWNMLENLGVYPSHIQFSLANPSESEHSLPVASYTNLMGTYQWEVQHILGYYGLYPLVI